MNHILCFKRICGNLTTKTTTTNGGDEDPRDIYSSLAMLDQQVAAATPPLVRSRLRRLRSRLRRLRNPTPPTKLATKGVTTAPTSPSTSYHTTTSPYYRGLADFSLLSPLPPSPPLHLNKDEKEEEENGYHDDISESTAQTSDDEDRGDTDTDTEATSNEEKPSFEEITKFLLSSTKVNNTRGVKSELNWWPPSPGWVKLNVDGTVLENNAMSGCGGLLRSETGQWLLGFSIRSDSTNVLEVELCALRMGLVLAWDQGHRNLCCETGCVRAHCLFQCSSESDDGVVMRSAEVDLLVKEIRRLLRRPWNVQLRHVFRSANTAAGYLAKLASKSAMDLQVWSSPPPGIQTLLQGDITPHV